MLKKEVGRKACSFVGALIVSTVGSAAMGAWSSGGGELVKDADNPWFLQNTKEVRYCIQVDRENFHVSEGAIDRSIHAALDYWKKEFAKAYSPGDLVVLGSQKFVKTACSSNTDLAFQFGHLDGEQIERIGNPNQFISLAVRTDYDPVHLRGKGFIYVSPDSGPLKVQDPNLVENPWNLGNHGLLVKVLIHELGHVFGLQHSSNNPFVSPMSAVFPEAMLSNHTARNAASAPVSPTFGIDQDRPMQVDGKCFEEQGPDEITKKFFGLPDGTECLQSFYRDGVLSLYGRARSGDYQLIGTARLGDVLNTELENLIMVWLPPEQTVYDRDDLNLAFNLLGPQATRHHQRSGTYRNVQGTIERSIVVKIPLYPLMGSIDGIMDGQLYVNLAGFGFRGNVVR